MYYRYTKKWVELFYDNEIMIGVETGHFIKGMHNLLNAHFDLRNVQHFDKTLVMFERFAMSQAASQHDNFRIQTFVYINSAIINRHCMTGTFTEGLKAVPYIEEKLKEYSLFIDNHRVLVFNYKIATLYFGAGDFDKAIDYLQKIINDNIGLRSDLQCYARLLHLICHYELGNFEIIESLTKSVFRFMAKMQNFTVVEEAIFKFLRSSFHLPARKLKPEFEHLLSKIKHFEKSRFETRSFVYLDIISWLESKVQHTTMSVIVHNKYLLNKRKV